VLGEVSVSRLRTVLGRPLDGLPGDPAGKLTGRPPCRHATWRLLPRSLTAPQPAGRDRLSAALWAERPGAGGARPGRRPGLVGVARNPAEANNVSAGLRLRLLEL